MRIISWNVNGIRAAANKGLLAFLESDAPDILGLQETKAHCDVLDESLINPFGYDSAFHSGERRGYSGVALYTKPKPLMIHEGLGIERYDREGRVIVAQYPEFFLLNVYFPNGQQGDERLQYKLDFYEDLFKYTNQLRADGHHVIIMGDYNTAHKPIDLAHPKANENYSGFLPIEREWLDRIEGFGYVDTFRAFNQEPHQYSWWTYRMGARKRNVGWRIDYVFVNKELMPS
ncbi:MAG: exodeoxyribonuclease III, partial [Candidatus Margulisiibacteriota bacterium]